MGLKKIAMYEITLLFLSILFFLTSTVELNLQRNLFFFKRNPLPFIVPYFLQFIYLFIYFCVSRFVSSFDKTKPQNTLAMAFSQKRTAFLW